MDGGDLSGELPEMLRRRLAGSLRAAICTFPSPERLGGILDLLADGYPIKECWLPARLGAVAALARDFNGDWPGWFALAGDHAPPAFPPPAPPSGDPRGPAAVLLGLALAGCPGGPVQIPSRAADPEAYVSMVLAGLIERAIPLWRTRNAGPMLRDTARALCRGGGFGELVFTCGSLIMDEAGQRPAADIRARVAKGLALAAMASALTEGGPRVRYFRHTNGRQRNLVARHPIMCLNGVEAFPGASGLDATPLRLFRQAGRMSGSGRGLVFQYGDGRCGALFCGNSRLAFAAHGLSVTLCHPTVIAAPGQGGTALDAAYGRIVSLDPHRDIWVRTHFSYARKIAPSFRRLPNTLCLNNCVNRSVQEVVLEFGDGRWHRLAGMACAYI
ncbi:MAG: hypothetical protein H0S80_13570 [Desulfovibrionaceae bacterium]|nr:hypothetical protein [Desulfovibrionaceae bacterium]